MPIDDDDSFYVGNSISTVILTPWQGIWQQYPSTTFNVTFQGINVTWQGDPNVTWQGV
jgi:hypothetical protein